jgi:hypothetical protein
MEKQTGGDGIGGEEASETDVFMYGLGGEE